MGRVTGEFIGRGNIGWVGSLVSEFVGHDSKRWLAVCRFDLHFCFHPTIL